MAAWHGDARFVWCFSGAVRARWRLFLLLLLFCSLLCMLGLLLWLLRMLRSLWLLCAPMRPAGEGAATGAIKVRVPGARAEGWLTVGPSQFRTLIAAQVSAHRWSLPAMCVRFKNE